MRSLVTLMFACAVGAIPICAAAVEADTMRFRNECSSNAFESCFVVAEGKLDSGAPDRFERLLSEGIEGDQVLLNSLGGKLAAGLKLGRAIRAHDMRTVVGSWDVTGQFKEEVDSAQCLSACSYAFLGGVNRRISKGSRIGFHQFALPGGGLEGPQGLSGGQRISAELVSYLVEMGVDARLFIVATGAASDTMFYPSLEQLADYEVVTPEGFGHFILEPFKKGIVATSKRQDQPRAYDYATKLTALCRGKVAYFLLKSAGTNISASETLGVSISFPLSNLPPIQIPRDRTRAWDHYAELVLTPAEVKRLLKADQILVRYELTRAGGGDIVATLNLNELDKKMLAAAFRFCI